MIKTYLFDFDGTLVDSMPMYTKMFLGILDEEGVSYSDDIINIITPLGTTATALYMIDMGVKMTHEQLLCKMKQHLEGEYSRNVYAKQNVKETLKALKSNGASLNILTACSHPSLELCLQNNGIYELFDNVWSCEDFGMSKTNPEIYRLAADRMRADVKDILFADDNLEACQTAKSAGLHTCGVYDESSRHLVDVIKESTDLYAYDLSEILKANI